MNGLTRKLSLLCSALSVLLCLPLWAQISTKVYEAESATLVGARAFSEVSGFTGSGYADFQNPSGDSVTWTVGVPTTGPVQLIWRYGNGDSANRPLDLYVNGARVTRLSFFPTGGWSSWGRVSYSIPQVQAGQVRFSLVAVGWSGPNLDSLTAAVPAAPSGATDTPDPANVAPTITVLSAQPNPVVQPNVLAISFLVNDPDDDSDAVTLSVGSTALLSTETVPGKNGTISIYSSALPVGSGTLTLRVTDSHGASATASVPYVAVSNTPAPVPPPDPAPSPTGLKPTQAQGPVGVVGYSLDLPAQDADGWTIVPPLAPDARAVYVSSSGGDDGNSGFSPDSAKKTLRSAWRLMRKGVPDRLLLKRGDSWNEKLEIWGALWSGRSRSEPQIIMDYGDPGLPMPSIAPLPTWDGSRWNGETCFEFQPGFTFRHIWVFNLDLYQPSGDPGNAAFNHYTNPDSTGLAMEQSGYAVYLAAAGVNDLHWENVRTRWAHHGFSLSGGTLGSQWESRDIRIRRCRIVDIVSYDHAFANPAWLVAASDVLVEDCIFTHNGASLQGDKFSHNMYYSINTNCTCRGNLFLDSAGVSVKLTNSSVNGSPEHSFTNLWFADNLFCGTQPWWAQGIPGDLQCADPTLPNFVRAAHYNQLMSGNVHVDLEESGWPSQLMCSDQTRVTGNYWVNAYRESDVMDHFGVLILPYDIRYHGGDSGSNVRVDHNTSYQWTQLPVSFIASWGGVLEPVSPLQINVTADSNDIDLPAGTYVDPSRDLERYDREVLGGPGTLEHIRQLARRQERGRWDGRLTSEAMGGWVKAGFVKR